MKNLNIRNFVWAIVVFSIASWVALLLITGTKLLDAWEALKQLPTVISADMLLWLWFVKWGWKNPICQKLFVPFPCLEGTWKGELVSTWIDPSTGSGSSTKEVYLVIHQSFIHTSCTLFSLQMTSRSYVADFLIDKENNSKKLTYSYTSTPKVTIRDRSIVHDGTAKLEIIVSPGRRLRGEYWTNRRSTGEVTLTFYSSKFLEEYPVNNQPAITAGEMSR